VTEATIALGGIDHTEVTEVTELILRVGVKLGADGVRTILIFPL
jgi:hypothetical protein